MAARPPKSGSLPRRMRALATGVITLALSAGALTAIPANAAEPSTIVPFDAVNMFIGTELDTTQNKSNDAYGNTYPGATLPFGMVQSSPTTYKPGETNDLVREKGGYEYTGTQLRGFGMTRYQGTGCTGRYGGYDFPTIPYAGPLAADGALPVSPAMDLPAYFMNFSHDNETSQPGYDKVKTDDGVSTEPPMIYGTANLLMTAPMSGRSRSRAWAATACTASTRPVRAPTASTPPVSRSTARRRPRRGSMRTSPARGETSRSPCPRRPAPGAPGPTTCRRPTPMA